ALPAGYVTNDTDCDDSDDAFHPGATEADCTDPADYNCDGSVGYADADGDGFAACEECDDARADVNPEAPEICDEADNNCNSVVDEDAADAGTWYADYDGDGYGNLLVTARACAAPGGFVADNSDCDDLHSLSFPGGSEVCDGHDNDCDGTVDVGASDAQPWYADADGDQYGDPSQATVSCEAPDGAVLNGTDCDDTSAAARPGGTEVCDGLDNDCDGEADESATDAPTWYADGDADGYGDLSTNQRACAQPEGYVADSRDCDDAEGAAHPGAAETCADSFDNDCDGQINEADAVDAAVWHLDADRDGFGRPGVGLRACEAPDGYVSSTTDCDDLEASVYPGAPQRCDGLANDCDAGLPADESDVDGDGYMACEDDCDDALANVHPGAPEHCDGVDEDCNTLVDDRAVDQTVWHLDADGDGFGHFYITRTQCVAPASFVADATDCDDDDANANPVAREIPGNGKDDTCDGEDRPLLVYSGSRFAGELYAVDYFSGAVVWSVDGLGELLDVAVGPDGTVYAADLNQGIVAVAADGSSSWPVLSGYTSAAGLWYDLSTDTLLLATFDGSIVEVDPASGSSSVLVSGAPESFKDVVRFAGDETLYVAADGMLRTFVPSTGLWEDAVSFPYGPWGLVPANNGGFYAGSGNVTALMRSDALGNAGAVMTSLYDYGLCPSPLGEGEVLLADHTSGIWQITPEDGARWEVTTEALDQPFSCATNGLSDLDGDGYVAIAYGGDDCDDASGAVNPAAVDTFGTGVDENCDFVDGNDGDGDGVPFDHTSPDCADQDDTDPAVGFLPSCIQRSCAETLAVRGAGTPSGVYRIDPDGDMDPSDAFEVYCDMETEGGGWTLLAKMTNADGNSRWASYSSHWYTGGSFGAPEDPAEASDAKSRAWSEMGTDELMVVRVVSGVLPGTVGVVSTAGCLQDHPAVWAFQRHSEDDADCAMSCGTTVRTGDWAQSYTDASLKFRCKDNDGDTTVGGYIMGSDDNSMITTLNNGSNHDNNFGLGAGYNTASQDWDYSTDDYGNPGDSALMLVYGR
ncbi:MAG: hypothetical protein JXX28_12515, partial [Deltaproteobacteria bacterium]|nr:hypothetical protein [Deltaproteobacteria bacterium]